MSAELVSFLSEVRTLLADEKAWTQDAIARDAQGKVLDTGNDPAAVSWCLIGACEHVEFASHMHQQCVLQHLVTAGELVVRCDADGNPDDAWNSIEEFNDHAKHRDVIVLLDRAIVAAS